ncbi:anthrone oxygenase family protein [Pseudonocardia humida]|uniref:DUF1772 domain-containing protein n=1 Tax=Pseudonocardia humida TaxID=2800819 RepID=A0ABT1AB85_9PSEU|nr:anthrone oxygenase family protein [Pseudonocardia humida]MCO1660198.1 DUF1772 domain-containing protein [Pseudonocardia humida]
MDWVAGVAAVGSGLVGGVFFAFSVAVMPAFARLPARHGVAGMQTINTTIVRAPFLIVFVGTVLACVARVVLAPTDVLGVAGAALYVLGGFGVTMALNVPLNNRLAAVGTGDDDGFWSVYATRWTLWNHVRTVACTGAAALLTAAA